jgi:hypothetical protein
MESLRISDESEEDATVKAWEEAADKLVQNFFRCLPTPEQYESASEAKRSQTLHSTAIACQAFVTAVLNEAAMTIASWTGGTADTDGLVEEAWRERWLKEREGRAATRPADDHQQDTLFKEKTLRRHEGLNKAQSSLLIQIRTGAIGLRSFLFSRGVPEVLTPSCECGEGQETVEHLVMWCLAPPLTRRWEKAELRTRRDFYSVLQCTCPPAARLARKILGWLMDSGRLPMYDLARRLELELAV